MFHLQVQTDLQFIKEDISAVEKHRMDLYRARDRYSVKLRMLNDSGGRKSWHSSMDRNSSGLMSSPLNLRGGLSSGSLTKKNEGKSQMSSHGHGVQRKDAISGSDSQYIEQSGLALVRKRRVHKQVILVQFSVLEFFHFSNFFFPLQCELGFDSWCLFGKAFCQIFF